MKMRNQHSVFIAKFYLLERQTIQFSFECRDVCLCFQPDVGLVNKTGYYHNGRLSCRFRRKRIVENAPNVFNLDRNYYLLMARGAADKGRVELHYSEPLDSLYWLTIDSLYWASL